jgi:hypothetical protein
MPRPFPWARSSAGLPIASERSAMLPVRSGSRPCALVTSWHACYPMPTARRYAVSVVLAGCLCVAAETFHLLGADGHSARGGHPPNAVSDIVGDEQGTSFIDCDTDRPASGIALCVEKAGQNVDRFALRAAVDEGHKLHLVPTFRGAVP